MTQGNLFMYLDFCLYLWYDVQKGGNKMIRIAIIDDQNIICSQIDTYILEALKKRSEKADISTYYSGEGFCMALKQGEVFDLIFLDIELGNCSGIDVSAFVREKQNDQTMQIVYVTGKNEYDRLLFEYRPFGFIAKPVTYYKIANMISKYQTLYGKRNPIFQYTLNHANCWVRLENILYFESDDRKVNIYLSNTDEVVSFYMKMSEVYEQVKEHAFFFIHKSYIVNTAFVSVYHYDSVQMTDGTCLPISQKYRRAMKGYLAERYQKG